MGKIVLRKPTLFLLYGFPGSGKSHFSKEICNVLQAAYVSADRIRYELFEKPQYDKPEDSIVNHLAEYMAEEFLNSGVSVVLDANAYKKVQRRKLRDLARRKHAKVVLVWFQIDAETAFLRTKGRDRRTSDSKYARQYSKAEFDDLTSKMQHPEKEEDYLVLSGKHSFPMQKSTILRKLYDIGLVSPEDISAHVVKPGMINLVPPTPTDGTRNINIH